MLALVASGACGNFENPEVVVDTRVLAMSATPPEQLLDIDINNPPKNPADLLGQLVPTQVCVLVVDPQFDRRLYWQMDVCVLSGSDRCTSDVTYNIGNGLWDDPDLSPTPPELCATVKPDGNLLGVALSYLDGDQFKGLGGIYYGVALRIGGEDAPPGEDLYAAKNLRLMPRIPADIQANNNPSLDHIEAALLPDGEAMVLPVGRCLDQMAPFEVAPDTKVRILPVEADGAREDYVVPTTDGGERMFTESLTYQWFAEGGNFSSGTTGGPHDAFGNPAPLHSDWHAPKAKDLDGPTDFDIWVIQRDERLGVHWYQSCIRVVPQ
jgi:hypothetical protein